MRDDKSWKEASDLPRLRELYKISKQHSDIPDFLGAPSSKKLKSEDSDSSSFNKMEVDSDDLPSTPKSKQSPLKRKLKEENDDTPVKKTPGTPKPLCKYGAACYQRNPDHLAQFSHTASPSKARKHLPDVFSGMTFYLPDTVDKYEQIKRYIIAFDGEVVEEFDKDTATHIITADNSPDNGSSKHVPITWVWGCIKKKKIVPLT